MDPHPPDASPATAVRRQARGVDRRERLLDAAAAVIAAHGWGEASVREIAARAGASMSSLYHFFPDKEAVLLALGERYLARIVAASDAWSAPSMAALPLDMFFGELFSGQRALLVSLPGFAGVHEAIARVPAGAALARRMEALLAERAATLLRWRYPELAEARRRAVAAYLVVVLHAVLERVLLAPDGEGAVLQAEALEAMRRYLAPLEDARDAARARATEPVMPTALPPPQSESTAFPPPSPL